MKADDACVWLCATEVDGEATEAKLTIDKLLTAHLLHDRRSQAAIETVTCCDLNSSAYLYIILSKSDEKIRI